MYIGVISMDVVYTICPFCGVGCGLNVRVHDRRVVSVLPAKNHPVNQGALCIKGWKSFQFVHSPQRLTDPLMKKNGEFVKVSWNEALDFVAKRLKEVKEKYGPDSIMFLSSAKCSNEENYLLQKLARAVIGTNNVDHCARLCHSSTVSGLISAFGSGAMTNSINEIYETDAIFVIGSNTTEQHPIIGSKIINAVSNGTKLVIADPRRIQLSNFADVHMRHLPGTDVALLNGMAHVIIKEELYDKDFIENRTEGFEEFKKLVEKYTPEYVSEITGVPPDLIIKGAKIYAEAEKAMIFYAMGITQHVAGTENVMAVANLALLTGNVGKPGTGVNPLRGQNNVQGACDMGGLPDYLPGYARVDDDEKRKRYEEVWGVKLPSKVGLTLTEAIDLVKAGEIKGMYIMAENPVLSDPDQCTVIEALERLEFLAVQDIFLTETAEHAHVVLPATTWLERSGTYTNTERRVQIFNKVLEPYANTMPDWKIICEISNRLGYPMNYNSPKEILDEINKVAPIYGGITWERLSKGYGLQWPCWDESHPGTSYLHAKKFTRGKGKFNALEWKAPPEWRDDKYPFIMTTGRVYYQWHTGTMTRKIPVLEREAPVPIVEMNPEDMKELKIRKNELVRITSRRGSIDAYVRINEYLPKRVVFVPFHYKESPVNKLTGDFLDPISKIPELKVTAVKIEPVR